MKSVQQSSILVAFLLLLLLPSVAMAQYTITGSGTTFTATYRQNSVTETIGEADQPINIVINAIKEHTLGHDNPELTQIQFGNGEDELDIGTATARFENWSGEIVISGKITSQGTTPLSEVALNTYGTVTTGVIYLAGDNARLTSTADIRATKGIAILSRARAAVNISGGNIWSGSDRYSHAILNLSAGDINISGGNIYGATTGDQARQTIYNFFTGNINISGGNISSTECAVYNNYTGKIRISGNAVITSEGYYFNPSDTYVSSQTIFLGTQEDTTDVLLEITGGKIINNAEGNGTSYNPTSAIYIYNNFKGAVIINGGEISATGAFGNAISLYDPYNNFTGTVDIINSKISVTGGNAVYSNSTGAVNITSSEISATGGNAVYSNSTGAVNITSSEISATGGNAVYSNSAGAINISGGKISATIGVAVYKNSTGTVDITSSEISATGGNAVYSNTTGAVNITSSEISATTGVAVYKNSTGAVNISGGKISATTGVAVYKNSSGKITLTENAVITSRNASAMQGTIYLADVGNEPFEITGGKVANTSNAVTGNAIYNASVNAVNISGGEVSAVEGNAVYSNSAGAINISGGVVSAVGGNAVYSNSTGAVNISGGEVSRIYNNSSGAVNFSCGKVSASSNAVYNNSTGKITVSGDALITTYVGNTIYLNDAGDATDVRLEITGGKVENTATTGYPCAICNASTGAVSISGGEVSATSNYGSAVYSNSIGKITVSGNAVITSKNISATQGTIHLEDIGDVTAVRLEVTGGKVENTNDYKNPAENNNVIYNRSAGAVSISGGEVLATSYRGIAINNASTGKITVSGNAVIASNHYNSSTFQNPPGAIYSSGFLEITGGTITNNNNYNAVYNDGEAVLSGAPNIIQPIRTLAGKLSVGEQFSPAAEQIYTVALPSNTEGEIAVVDGKDFIDNFAVKGENWGFIVNANNLVLKQKTASAAVVAAPTFESSTSSAIIINAAAAPDNGQAVEYAKNTTNSAPQTGWQTGLTFSGLTHNTTYYIFARAKESDDYFAGAASEALEAITGKLTPTYTIPTLNATYGDLLSSVALPTTEWEWEGTGTVGDVGVQTHKARFTPSDTENYKAVLNIDVSITVAKAAGVAIAAPELVSKTYGSITISASAPANGQAVEYAINDANTVPTMGWRENILTFSALFDDTDYYIFARAKENETHLQGEASPSLMVTTLKSPKPHGAAVAAPTLASKTTTSITIGAVVAAGFTVEYGINTANHAPVEDWQTGLTFSNLTPNTYYYIFARTQENEEYQIGAASVWLGVMTGTLYYDVTFNSQEGSAVTSQQVEEGAKVTAPTDPTRAGYTFLGWFKEAAGTTEWDFDSDVVAGNITLYAKWFIIETTPIISNRVNPSIGSIGVQAIGNAIQLTNVPNNAKVEVYGLDGKRVYAGAGALHATPVQGGDMRIAVPAKGMYIVRVGSQTLRVAVK